jgi:hypothetical protein
LLSSLAGTFIFSCSPALGHQSLGFGPLDSETSTCTHLLRTLNLDH